MGALREAMLRLAALDVIGVRNSYGVEAVPLALSRGQLPALLLLPLEPAARLFPARGEAVQAESLALDGGGGRARVALTHLLLVAAVPGGTPNGAGVIPARGEQLGLLTDLMDAYFTALAGDLLLGGHLVLPPEVAVETGVYRHGPGMQYLGCAFRHLWTLAVEEAP